MDSLDERYKAFIAKYGIYGPKSRVRKPVVEIDPKNISEMWKYEFQAKNSIGQPVILASNSLNNLKQEIRNRRWVYASISCKDGMFSVGQTAVYEYPYEPNYKRR